MWIIQTPLRTTFHDTQRLLLVGLYFERAFCFCVFRTAYEEMKK